MEVKFSFHHLLLIITVCVVTSLNSLEALASLHGEIDLQVGWFAAKQGKAQHINIEELIGDDFSVHHSSDQNFLLESDIFLRH